MKKNLVILGSIGIIILIFALFYKLNIKDPAKHIKNIKNDLTSYEISGVLELVDDEALKTIKIQSLYKVIDNNDYYYVRLEDEQTGQIQTIVKNKEGVYVLAHAFNRAFKFNSKWPNNGFKPYILENIFSIFDKEYQLEKIRDGFIITSEINDPLHPQATSTQILFNQNNVIQQINLLDEQNNEIMQFNITTYILNPEIDNEIFTLNSTEDIPTSAYDDNPLYPSNIYETELVDQLKITDGFILRYNGDRYFTLVQKKLNSLDTLTIEIYDGEFYVSEEGLIFIDKESAVLIKDNCKTTIYSKDLKEEEKIDILLSLENNVVIEQ